LAISLFFRVNDHQRMTVEVKFRRFDAAEIRDCESSDFQTTYFYQTWSLCAGHNLLLIEFEDSSSLKPLHGSALLSLNGE
jgi:hypothetical protein